jgi:hypothetical protein
MVMDNLAGGNPPGRMYITPRIQDAISYVTVKLETAGSGG